MEWPGDESIVRDTPQKDITSREKKVACRYGRGCTHISDPMHQNRFWHPPIQRLNSRSKQIQVHVCHECGNQFQDLRELQLHLKRKTAWSNQGLVGCRVSCFVDNREWQEGHVIAYHKSGKHCVEFTSNKERRLFKMLKIAFYIIERGSQQSSSGEGEVKEAEDIDMENMAPLEDWHYCEDITIEYAHAQSVLQKVYEGRAQETGHKTAGHLCVTEEDRALAKQSKGSLLYGELLPRGVNKALGRGCLNAADARVVYDLGMGLGKVAMQAFLQFPHLARVYGVELSKARYELAALALRRLVALFPEAYCIAEEEPGRRRHRLGGGGRWLRVRGRELLRHPAHGGGGRRALRDGRGPGQLLGPVHPHAQDEGGRAHADLPGPAQDVGVPAVPLPPAAGEPAAERPVPHQLERAAGAPLLPVGQ
ncbi:unnamed protein product, partial [Heterosigma akashiwo]